MAARIDAIGNVVDETLYAVVFLQDRIFNEALVQQLVDFRIYNISHRRCRPAGDERK